MKPDPQKSPSTAGSANRLPGQPRPPARLWRSEGFLAGSLLALTLIMLHSAAWYGVELIRLSKENELQRHMEDVGALAQPLLGAAAAEIVERVDKLADAADASTRAAAADASSPDAFDNAAASTENPETPETDWTLERDLAAALEDEGALKPFHDFAARARLRGLALVDPSGRALIDTAQPRRDFGAYEFIGLDGEQLDAALSGAPAASLAYTSGDAPLKRVYVPLRDNSNAVVAALCLTAGRDYLGEVDALTGRLRWVLGATTALALLVGGLFYQLLRRQRRLERNAAKMDRLSGLGELAAGFAHEVRNPLGVIGACAEDVAHVVRAEVFTDPREREAALDSCQDILEEVQRLNRLVKRFLQYSSAEGDSGAVAAPARVRKTLASALGMIRRAAEQKNIALAWRESDVAPELRAWIGEDGLRQIMLNLVLNAIQASPPDTRIDVEARATGREIAIEVRDQGPGIPRELRAQIFHPFFTTRPEGSGLGLSIAHQIARGAGAALELLDSPRGGGARFQLRIRRAMDHVEPDAPDAIPGNERFVGGNESSFGGNEHSFPGNERCVGGNESSFGGNERSIGGNESSFGGNERSIDGNESSFGGNEPSFPGNKGSFPRETHPKPNKISEFAWESGKRTAPPAPATEISSEAPAREEA